MSRDLRCGDVEGPERDEEHREHRQAAGEGREREEMPPAREEVAGVPAEPFEARATPGHGAAAQLAARPVPQPGDEVAEIARETVAYEHGHEGRDDDSENCDADEGDGRKRSRL